MSTLEEILAGDTPIRDASTVILLRDSDDGPELFMLERNVKSEFVGGVFVFPGGAVDDEDSHEQLEQLTTGLSDAVASGRVGRAHGGLGFWVAAIRECFEEAGVLIGEQDGVLLSFDDATVNESFDAGRQALNDRKVSFSEFCGSMQVTLPVDRLVYFSRWITPTGMPRRFDTCFFLCAAPTRQTPLHDGFEAVSGRWITPEKALTAGESGEIKLVPATEYTLKSLCGFDSVEVLLNDAAKRTDIPSICPEIILNDVGKPERVRIPLPEGEVEVKIGDRLRGAMGGG
ncbi:MAG: hypothetical protein DRQ60_02855 [Gammaproteobacteria bacterium]|nr:MAG: hypothetical protein DRQ60_02855 [Gammaproteobacteria bacterium]